MAKADGLYMKEIQVKLNLDLLIIDDGLQAINNENSLF
jgi:hypothetical protein